MKRFVFTLILSSLVLILLNCDRKQLLPEKVETNSSLTVQYARAWFESESESNSLSREAQSRFSKYGVSWDKAVTGKNTASEYVEVPLQRKSDSSYHIGVYENKRMKMLDPDKLWIVFYKDKEGKMQERIKQYYPDESAKTGSFSGRIMLWSWNGKLMGGDRYQNGKPVARIYPNDSLKSGKTNTIVCSQFMICAWYRSCTGPNNDYLEVQDIKLRADNGMCYYPTSWDFQFPWYNGPNCTLWNFSYTDYFTECTETGSGSDPGAGGGSTGFEDPFPQLSKIYYSGNLGTENSAKLEAVITQLRSNCLGKTIFDKMVAWNRYLNFMINPAISTPGIYSPSTRTITFKSAADIDINVFREELFHAYQDVIYGGTSQYSNNGFSNIEFEAKLLRDMVGVMIGGAGVASTTVPPANNLDYLLWLNDITSGGTTYPNSWSDLSSNYFNYLELFKQANPAYNKPTINTLNPDALLNAINSSGCPK
ncbi:hypothetical protein LZD49_35145 [Dyadobacter sp. CY261]|uniref:hypothetical protein n=1 Tax=Dyadobacter sp. CY261 TaxID=2907203 RepID=UPI001F3E641D|nr:hypothetical protein [Dyadobacter sp. CY261]MCF0075760.1 hypothetical protein [Dyadobacter sp. CY261]